MAIVTLIPVWGHPHPFVVYLDPETVTIGLLAGEFRIANSRIVTLTPMDAFTGILGVYPVGLN
jgi:hypothetical protein